MGRDTVRSARRIHSFVRARFHWATTAAISTGQTPSAGPSAAEKWAWRIRSLSASSARRTCISLAIVATASNVFSVSSRASRTGGKRTSRSSRSFFLIHQFGSSGPSRSAIGLPKPGSAVESALFLCFADLAIGKRFPTFGGGFAFHGRLSRGFSNGGIFGNDECPLATSRRLYAGGLQPRSTPAEKTAGVKPAARQCGAMERCGITPVRLPGCVSHSSWPVSSARPDRPW